MKFSIVTPSFNSERFIAETIESVLSQKGDFEIEYVIVDSASSDNTIPIIKRYQALLHEGQYTIKCKGVTLKYVSEKDNGMYDAINQGFSMASGDVYAWINSDDIYLPGAFDVIAKSFRTYPEVMWLKGITSYINQFSAIYQAGKCFLYNQQWIQIGMYGRELYFIQQDSVFWRSDLWKTAGGTDTELKRAGDYALWIKFARYAPLYSVNATVSCFRKVAGQISEDLDAYTNEYAKVRIPEYNDQLRKKIKMYFEYCHLIPSILLRKFLYRLLFGRQILFLIEIADDEQPLLKAASYYVAE